MKELPLKGVRVISFEQFGAAPYATMFLADLGAEVLKVELPEGDFARHTRPLTLGPDDSLYFQSMNLNKKSIHIDLKNRDDIAFFHELVGTSHAVVNNLRGTLPVQLGLDYSALQAVNPRIVCGHISAYGRDNSRADRPGYDFLMQAEAGLMHLTGEPGSSPTRIGVSMIDYMTGMMLAFGLVSALRGAEKQGVGGDVDVSLFDAALHQLCYQGSWYLNEGLVTTKTPRSAHPSNTPVQLYKTQDGWIYIAAMTGKFWTLLIDALGCPEIAADPRFDSPEARLAHRDDLTAALDGYFTKHPTAHWIEVFDGEVPAAPVYDLEQALNNPWLDEIGMINTIAHPARPEMRIFANPLKLDGERVPQRAGPSLGQDTAAIRAEVAAQAPNGARTVDDGPAV
jgi:crotonobetainyl-CoA:carnitine CoA-transferase CaiB-like acyl-CoA transferase